MKTITELMDMAGRRVLVTGGAGHVGFAVSEALLELGATIALLDQDGEQSFARARELSSTHGGRAIGIGCDLMDDAATRTAVTTAVSRLRGLDAIVHCAAFTGTTAYPGWAVSFSEQTVEAWDAAMRVNLTSAFVLAQSAMPALVASGRGAVCLVGSTYGLVGPDMRLYDGTAMANPAAYGASKGGLIQLTRYLATLLAPSVRVNCVSPGGILRGQPESFVDAYVRRTPLRRMATEEDLKAAVAYLVTDASAYVTGHNLVVDGGWTAW